MRPELKSIIYILFASLLFWNSGCGLLSKIFKKKEDKPKAEIKVPRHKMRFDKEPVAGIDAQAPAGYDPVWMNGVQPMDSTKDKNIYMTIDRVDAKVDSIRLYVHIMDSAGTYYKNGTRGKWKNMWCYLTDSTVKDSQIVKKFSVQEWDENNHPDLGLYVVADFSGSMGDERANFVQESLRDFIREKRDKDAVGLIKFDHYVKVPCKATTDSAKIISTLKANGLADFGGMTAINNALYRGIVETQSIPKYKNKAILMFTDGYDNFSHFTKDTIIQLAREANIPICAIDFGDSTVNNYLQDIALNTGGTYHHIWNTYEFGLVFRDIYQRLMNTYTVTFAPKDVGWHKIRLRICIPNKTVSAHTWVNNSPRTDNEQLLYELLERKKEKNPPKLKLPSVMPPDKIVYFDFNISTPKDNQKEKIDEAVSILKEYDGLKVKIHGHTDFVGENDFNIQLSRQRVEAVQKALADAGVSIERLVIDGFGEEKPVRTNATKEGRAKNRRVEIQFYHD